MPAKDNDALAMVTVTPEAAGARIDRVLADALDGLSRSRIKALIEGGHVSRGGAVLREPSARALAGQVYHVTLPAAVAAVPTAQAIALDIRYEDDDVIVLDKPAGMVVHPAPGNPDGTLVNALLAHCGETLTGIGGVRRPGIVHRIDKGTSGLIVAAKNEAAHAALVGQFSARSVGRAYVAFAWGAPMPPAGRIDAPIGRHPKNRKKMAVVARNGRVAVTRYASEARYGPAAAPLASRLECVLETGRTHQIRVHLAHIGHPLLGDPVYGRADARRAAAKLLPPDAAAAVAALGRQALHARLLAFDHPVTGERLRFEADLPEDLTGLQRALEAARFLSPGAKSPHLDV